MAGEVLHLVDGDYSVGATGRYALNCASQHRTVVGDTESIIGGQLLETIAGIRKSVAAAQVIQGATVNIGNGEINVLDCLTDTLDVLQELATLVAAHIHTNTGTPLNAGAISANAARPDALKTKYGPLIS